MHSSAFLFPQLLLVVTEAAADTATKSQPDAFEYLVFNKNKNNMSNGTTNTTPTAKANADSDDGVNLEVELQKRAPRVISHMNEDHADSLQAYVLAFGEVDKHLEDGAIASAQLTGLDRYGFWLDVTLTDGSVISKVRVPFQGKVTSAKDLHGEAIRMHRLAYDKLGVLYKLRHGYYPQVMKMIGFQTYKKVRKQDPLVVLASTAAVLAVVVAAGSVTVWRRSRRP